jgi:hypothetical protein
VIGCYGVYSSLIIMPTVGIISIYHTHKKGKDIPVTGRGGP